jgi:hypothetical protein
MAKRFRYAFAKKKEAAKGKLSLGLAIASFLLFVAAVLVSFFLGESFGFLVGGLSVFGMLLSVYGFVMGLLSFSEENRKHATSIIGSIVNGMVVIIWIGIFLTGVS